MISYTKDGVVAYTDGGSVEWRIGNARGDFDSIEYRLTGATRWHVAAGLDAVAVTLERIRAWHQLLDEHRRAIADPVSCCAHGVLRHTSCRQCDPTAFMWPAGASL
jgi:hypothetical protein